MEFEWDAAKDKSNHRKHGVSFSDAARIFADPNIMTLYDREHSHGEDRYLSLGRTPKGQVLVISHTHRKSREEEIIRIISARRADTGEEAVYYGEQEPK